MNKNLEDGAEFESISKLVIFGGKEVGKSTLISKINANSFKVKNNQSQNKKPNIYCNISTIRIKMSLKSLLNIDCYEILLDNDNLEKEVRVYKSCLFHCQCSLFIVDISNNNSFEIFKKLIPLLNLENFPYTKKILIINKKDLINENKINEDDIKNFLESNKTFIKYEISLKNEDNNLIELINQINRNLNDKSNNISLNYFSFLNQNNKKILNILNDFLTVKLLLLGDSSVGKTSFINRFFNNEYNENELSTLGIDFQYQILKKDNSIIKLLVWETVGQEKFRAIPSKFYRNCDGILLFFDLEKPESFDNISKWIQDINDNNNETNCILYLLGNKIDLSRKISLEQANLKAKELNVKYFEISCKLNINIYDPVLEMINEILNKNINKTSHTISTKNLSLNSENHVKTKEGCCKNN